MAHCPVDKTFLVISFRVPIYQFLNFISGFNFLSSIIQSPAKKTYYFISPGSQNLKCDMFNPELTIPLHQLLPVLLLDSPTFRTQWLKSEPGFFVFPLCPTTLTGPLSSRK